jgi:transposase
MAIEPDSTCNERKITFDVVDREAGEVKRGRIRATTEGVRDWVGRFGGEEVHVAVEACTGWLFVCEALAEAGVAHLAEPVETNALRGKKRRAKTDRPKGQWHGLPGPRSRPARRIARAGRGCSARVAVR